MCHSDALHWQLVADVCQPTAAIEQFYVDHEKDDLPKGLRLSTRLLPEGEQAVDPLTALADDDFAALRARHPSAFSVASTDQSDEATHDKGDDANNQDQ